MLKAIASTPVLPAQKQTKTTNPVRPIDTWLGSTIQELQGDEFSSFGVSKESGGVHLTKVPAESLAGKAEVYMDVGEAMGRAMVELLKKQTKKEQK
jgi:hypothetical protein